MRRSVWPLLLLIFLFTGLVACQQETPAPSAAGGGSGLGRVHGTIVTPLEGSLLYVYKKGMDLYGPAFALSEATGADGSFDLQLPPGDYIVVARRRVNGENAGPVLAGDNKSDFINITVTEAGRELTIVAPTKVGDSRRLTTDTEVTKTGLSGLVTDADGKPVEGARVHVYDHVQMSERPKFVSEKTGPDGRYLLYLPAGGTYYLAARDKFGGPPKLGDLYGRYDQGTIEPSAIVVRQGEVLKDVNITVTKVW
ncbi:hypothetical protein DBW_2070 [Desulfuromonas sp. DDH964]|uniref:carboxypeptidase regulatory-like domain-containing protein n=1 Tax=Desulfuromonas sp. DDH964 TaxID=1823759 RepID=UPI00078CD745|nr:carboxypeptidase regulatory-like domain-containing protein [Desulfuromonas sp. DDH964]AMV72413.1 hypothetical protein DBW_2070 [Desulfuromonas sp. DDH964]